MKTNFCFPTPLYYLLQLFFVNCCSLIDTIKKYEVGVNSMKNLKIYYTIPFFIPEKDQECYSAYLNYAAIAKRDDLPFEMISFQDSPGRFLTDSLVFKKMGELGDVAFPITVLNNEIVKISELPTQTEFSNWFESLDTISFEKLLAEVEEIEPHTFPSKEEILNFSCTQSCFSCNPEVCGFLNPELESELDK